MDHDRVRSLCVHRGPVQARVVEQPREVVRRGVDAAARREHTDEAVGVIGVSEHAWGALR